MITSTPFRALIALLFLCTFSFAAETKKSFDLPAGPALDTFKQFAAQSGTQLLYAVDVVENVRTAELKGSFTPAEALERLLLNTGLSASSTKTGFAINKQGPESPNAPRALANNSDRPNEKTDVKRNEEGKVVLDTFEVFGKKSLNMDVKRTQDDIQPYVIFDQKAIQASGATTLEGFLSKSVTSASMTAEFAQANDITGVVVTPGISLRGLSPNETLILVDGRRVAQRSSITGIPGLRQADLNGIPLSAIERIDVLPTSASGIYGGNATGGVINIILRRDYSSVQLSLTYGNTFDTDVNYRRLELNGGYTFDEGRTNLMFAVSASDGGELWLQDRDFRDRYFAINRANLPPSNSLSVDSTSIFLPTGTTTNIRSTNGQNLTLKPEFGGGSLNSLITSVPTGYTGPASDNGAGLIAAAGKYNYEFAPLSSSGGTVLRHTPEQFSYLMTLRREMSPWLSLFLDANGSQTTTTRFSAQLNTTVNLLATNPGNPFNQPISVRVPAYGAESTNEYSQTAMRISGGAIVKLPADWNLGLDYTWDENTTASTSAEVVNQSAQGGVNPAIATGTLNVFRDLRSYPIDYSPYFFSTVPESSPVKVKSNNASARASGPLKIRSGWHPLQIAASAEYVDQTQGELRSTTPNFFTGTIGRTYVPATSQSSSSIYTELKWPLIVPQQKIPAIERFEIFAAGRYDAYRLRAAKPDSASNVDANWNLPAFTYATTKLDASTPMFGISYQPIKDLTIRANYAEGFLPPTVAQLVPGAPFPNTLFTRQQVKDVLRGNELIGTVDVVSGGNPDLRPESSESWSAGLIFTPRAVRGLRFSADWTKIDKGDAITTVNLFNQSRFDQFSQAFPEMITRGAPSDGFPVGKITLVRAVNVNFARAVVEAIDFAADYELPTSSFGTFTLSAKATRNIHVIQQLTPTAAPTETVGGDSFNGYMPKWRGIAALTWERREWTMGVSSQYFSSTYWGNGNHTIVAELNTDHIPSQAYFDIFARYTFGPNARFALLKGMEVSLNVNNIFNKEPPVLYVSPYYVTSMGDARLANYLISVRKTF